MKGATASERRIESCRCRTRLRRFLRPGRGRAPVTASDGPLDRSLPFDRENTISVLYEGVEVGQNRLDLVVGGLIVVEPKAIKRLDDVHFAVVRSYLRAMGMEHGLLLNFAAPTLQIKRVIAANGPQPHLPGFLPSLEVPSGSE